MKRLRTFFVTLVAFAVIAAPVAAMGVNCQCVATSVEQMACCSRADDSVAANDTSAIQPVRACCAKKNLADRSTSEQNRVATPPSLGVDAPFAKSCCCVKATTTTNESREAIAKSIAKVRIGDLITTPLWIPADSVASLGVFSSYWNPAPTAGPALLAIYCRWLK